MTTLQVLIVLCGLAAVLYGLVTSRQILSLGSGNDKMQEIAGAIQEGARAYLNRQYMTIAIVGVVIFALIWIVFDLASGIGFLIGAFFSGAAGYVGMNISVRSNVRTTHAASNSLAEGLSVSFKAGAVTGMLVAGFALLSIAIFYFVLQPILGINNPLWTGILCLAFFEGSFASEIIRGGIVSVEKGQWEASKTIGLARWKTYVYVVLPQAVPIMLPPLTGILVNLIKHSAILSFVAVFELTTEARNLIADTFMSFEIWMLVGGMYLVMTIALSTLVGFFERRVRGTR